LTGVYYCFGRLEEGVEGWRRHEGGTLRLRPRLYPPSIFSNDPIKEAVPFIENDAEARAKARRRLIVVSALRSRARAIYPVFSPGGQDGWDGPLLDHLFASCAIPVVFSTGAIELSRRDSSFVRRRRAVRRAYEFRLAGLVPGYRRHRRGPARGGRAARLGTAGVDRPKSALDDAPAHRPRPGLAERPARAATGLPPAPFEGPRIQNARFQRSDRIRESLIQGEEDARRFLESPV